MSDNLTKIRRVADYQFGRDTGDALFPDSVEFKLSRTGRVSQVLLHGDRLATLKTDGRLTLSDEGGVRLHSALEPPRMRVEFGEESVSFLRDGRNGFAKFVVNVDDEVRARDEVLVTGPDDEFVTTGRAELSAVEMRDFETGVAVLVR
ncbi:MAG: PUA domain-containing protein [Halobacteriales archaeon]|nr:PUA domain-containing protein [Halobacteriales archaeon]